jgi:hypothetical protein
MTKETIRRFLSVVSQQQAQMLAALNDDNADDTLWEAHYREREEHMASLPALRTLAFWHTAEPEAKSAHAEAIAAVATLSPNLAPRWIERLDQILKRHLHLLEHCLGAAEERRALQSEDEVQENLNLLSQAQRELEAICTPDTSGEIEFWDTREAAERWRASLDAKSTDPDSRTWAELTFCITACQEIWVFAHGSNQWFTEQRSAEAKDSLKRLMIALKEVMNAGRAAEWSQLLAWEFLCDVEKRWIQPNVHPKFPWETIWEKIRRALRHWTPEPNFAGFLAELKGNLDLVQGKREQFPRPETSLGREPQQEESPAPTAGDPTAYLPASDFLDHERFQTFNAIRKALKENPSIRRRRPVGKSGKEVPNRLEIHAGDWHQFLRKQSTHPLDLPAAVVDAVMEAEKRKLELRKQTDEPGK